MKISLFRISPTLAQAESWVIRRPALLLLWAVTAWVSPARAQIVEIYTFDRFDGANSLTIPDGNSSGVSDTRNLTSAISQITSISVALVTTAEFNGDLYGYLRHETGFSILLNRSGRTSESTLGYADSGYNVRFEDSAVNGDIHLYQTVLTPAPGSPLTGLWAPDGRSVDPDLVLDSSPRNSLLSSFNGLDANGAWTLFLVDNNSGGTSTLNSWGLVLSGVPEPHHYALATGLALLAFGVWKRMPNRGPR